MIGMSSHASDGDCDGGPGAQEFGTGCAEFGPRFRLIRPSAPRPRGRRKGFRRFWNWASDADCEDGGHGSESALPRGMWG